MTTSGQGSSSQQRHSANARPPLSSSSSGHPGTAGHARSHQVQASRPDPMAVSTLLNNPAEGLPARSAEQSQLGERKHHRSSPPVEAGSETKMRRTSAITGASSSSSVAETHTSNASQPSPDSSRRDYYDPIGHKTASLARTMEGISLETPMTATAGPSAPAYTGVSQSLQSGSATGHRELLNPYHTSRHALSGHGGHAPTSSLASNASYAAQSYASSTAVPGSMGPGPAQVAPSRSHFAGDSSSTSTSAPSSSPAHRKAEVLSQEQMDKHGLERHPIHAGEFRYIETQEVACTEDLSKCTVSYLDNGRDLPHWILKHRTQVHGCPESVRQFVPKSGGKRKGKAAKEPSSSTSNQ